MAYGSTVLSATASFDPYWWRAAPHDEQRASAPPVRTDVAIVGSGITGLVAAVHLARGGRQVTVFEAKEPGHGASTRNAGYVGRTLKHGFGEIMEGEGLDKAKAVYGELMEAFLAVKETVGGLKIDCHYRQQGRLLLATSPAMYDAMAREFALREKHLGEGFSTLDRAAQRNEIATERYFGGVRIEDHAGLHPGLYHKGLLDAAREAGVQICAFTPVLGFRKEAQGFSVFLKGRKVETRDIIVATNGYSGRAWPWLMRRFMPFDAYQTVSAPMSENRIRSLLPGDRTFIDWNFNVDWMRIAPAIHAARLRRAHRRAQCRSAGHGGTAAPAAAAGVPRPGRFALRPCVDRAMRRHLRHQSADRPARRRPLRRRLLLRRCSDGHAFRPEAGAAHPGAGGRRERLRCGNRPPASSIAAIRGSCPTPSSG